MSRLKEGVFLSKDGRGYMMLIGRLGGQGGGGANILNHRDIEEETERKGSPSKGEKVGLEHGEA